MGYPKTRGTFLSTAKPRPRILLWDVETSPLLVTSWGLWKPHLSHQNIVEDSTLITAAWKWVGEDKVHSSAVETRAPRNDKALIKTLHEVLSQADVLVAHNGDKFDLRKFNTRAMFYGLEPLPPLFTVDTLKVARKYFAFTSNRLDYLGKFLCNVGKLGTSFDLWLGVLQGDAKALRQMVQYCKNDVLVLEKVYKRLRPYIQNHPDASLYRGVQCCHNCGSKKFQRRGTRYFRSRKYQRLQCLKCGAWFRGGLEK